MKSLDRFQDVPFKSLEDLMDPDKAGEGVMMLGEALGTCPETFVQFKVLEPC